MNNRLEYNLKILDLLRDFLKNNPEIRFIQALWILNIISKEDRFYEESKETLKNLRNLTNN